MADDDDDRETRTFDVPPDLTTEDESILRSIWDEIARANPPPPPPPRGSRDDETGGPHVPPSRR